MLPEPSFAGRYDETGKIPIFHPHCIPTTLFSFLWTSAQVFMFWNKQIPSVSDREYVMSWVGIHRCIDGQCFWPARGGPNLCRHQCPRYGFPPIDSSLRIRMAGLTSDQYLESGSDFHEMRDRLCPHIHNLTFNYLWDHHWKALRSRHLSHAVQTGSSCIQS